jgi:hypothetical protein
MVPNHFRVAVYRYHELVLWSSSRRTSAALGRRERQT